MAMYLTQGLNKFFRYTPDKLATIFHERRQTYREFGNRVQKFAGALKNLGLAPGDRVSIIALNSDHYLEMIMAILHAGGVVCPLNTRWSQKELEYALNDAESSILIVDQHFTFMAEALLSNCPSVTQLIVDGTKSQFPQYDELIKNAEPIPDTERSGDDIAMLLYTGGTTGFPKGVVHTHTSLCAGAAGPAAIGCGTSGGVFLHVAPMFHMASIQMLLSHFMAGGTHAVLHTFDPQEVLATIQNHKVTDILMVPTMIHAIVNQPNIGDFNLSSLKNIFYGAAPISQIALNLALNTLPDCSFIQGYGMTETCLTTMLPAFYHTVEGQKREKLAAAGTTTAFAEIKIADKNGQELPPGEVGEILVKGPTLMQNYWKQPEKTASVLKDGWFHTEDAAYLDHEGFVFIVDRLKDMIVSGGENIYSSEVENALLTHPNVDQCAVIGVPDEKWGEAVHAVVILAADANNTELSDVLISHCKTQIASYKCPRSISFVGSLPLSAAGKLLKAELRKTYAAQ